MDLVFAFSAGVFIGAIVVIIAFRKLNVGDLRIDRSEPDSPYLFLELSKGINEIESKKYAILRIKIKNFIPRE